MPNDWSTTNYHIYEEDFLIIICKIVQHIIYIVTFILKLDQFKIYI